ncbi:MULTISPECIES: hypothetical protein [Haloferax]|uniref:Uncharacterized protein n=3 Tax=Haloferax TaxID=2251 RepID=A0A6C0UUJ0_HALVO|nr:MULTISPECIES: hypothetical protein [Haloferax]ELK55676.1 hypothetical protein D320_03316 [Haloferax sp. BAB-2207]ELZ88015.1 hypothetical protein C452_14635 [Haloferax alexandrinus JCM 10717]MBC9986895.1 hypothetical protein [Haloferax sp. AS1]NLV03734.1 hypothetical protein [Haloferax alexandrinus]QIB79206.1 hypothetical protein G3A49_14240 [Haloferax alexandrinus]
MVKEIYDAGDTVPSTICTVVDEDDELTFGATVEVDEGEIAFAVPVEVYHGYGSAKHIYPIEQVDSVSDLFVTESHFEEVSIADNVQLYTMPHEALR